MKDVHECLLFDKLFVFVIAAKDAITYGLLYVWSSPCRAHVLGFRLMHRGLSFTFENLS